jgi:N-acetylglucosaminyldiphosphoundecaprenol N-acetyl-beta-D-mannosaminyltransferase
MSKPVASPSPLRTAAVSMLGIQICGLNAQELTELVCDVIRKSRKSIFAHYNMHSLYLFFHDARMREFYDRADYAHADGMSVIFLAQLLGLPLKREHRVTYADWTDMLMRRANDEGWRVFYLGSKPEVAERGAEVLRARHPNLNIRTAHGYFDASLGSDENRLLLSSIREYRPNLLLVGMGMPRQEHWVLDNLEEIDANAILVSGAAMDYVAGAVRTPPRWAGRIGLEWLFRLCHEPGRLWRRYLIEPWFVLAMLYTSFRSMSSRDSIDIPSRDQEIPGD